MMNRDLWWAVEACSNDGTAGAHRRITHHLVIFPRARAKASGQDGIQTESNLTWQADLSTMCVAAEHQIELGMRCLLVNLWRVG